VFDGRIIAVLTLQYHLRKAEAMVSARIFIARPFLYGDVTWFKPVARG